MPLAVGSRLGPYEVTGLLGAGGMGEVYRARDTKLQRDVAIKVLPDGFAHDVERLSRFDREARTLASLNHPHIAQIYGLEESDGISALVLELVEGPTLADRIAEGPLSTDEALPVARQIAEALEAAHEQGIIHRDLKPANIKVRPDGLVKVLDFGLAKALDPAPPASNAAASPTITSPAMMTGIGVLLGTAAYMSPEQAKGREAGKRCDVWAFGCVLYEMLTGRRAFEGDDLSDTLANVLKSQPDWRALPADVPPHVRILIQRCLAKDRHERIAGMSVALFVMRDSASVGPAAAGEPARRHPLWRRALFPTAAALLMSAVVGAMVWMVMRPSPARVTRFVIAATGPASLVEDQVSTAMAITRDGTRIVYHGTNALFVRQMDRFEPTALTGLGVPRAPFLSPDGRWVGFVDITMPALKRVDITGGPPQEICAQDGRSRGATWGDDDSIIFATSAASTGLQQVPSEGGSPKTLTTPNAERGEADHMWPHFLPGAHAVLFTITSLSGGIDAAQVAVLDLRTGTAKVLFRGGSQAKYVAGGHLVYVAAGTLRVVGFDLDRLAVSGTSVPLPERVMMLATDTAQSDVARDTGSLVYVERSTVVAERTLVWVDRLGREEPVAGAQPRAYEYPRLSPDETRVAVSIRAEGQYDNNIWMLEFAQKTLRRVTSKPGLNQVPLWMPDGRHFVFNAPEGEGRSLFRQAADGTGGAERLTPKQNQSPLVPSSVSRDGTRVLFAQQGEGSQADLMMMTLENRTVEPLTSTPFVERNGEISPDGQWLAYQSSESGRFEILVGPFPDVTAAIWRITEAGGSQPLWAADSRELFYRAPDGAIMSVRVEPGPIWTTPAKVIDGPYYAGRGATNDARTYDVGRDKRFLVIKEGAGTGQPAAAGNISVVQNWREELKGLVP